MRDPNPDAWDIGYHDGQLGRSLWRQILKPQFLEKYDSGYAKGRADARAQRTNRMRDQKESR